MTDTVQRATVEAFYQAYTGRDPKKLTQLLADDVDWTVSGPIDVLPFCGTRRGKAAVVDFITRLVPEVYRVFTFERETTLIDGDRVAALNRLLACSKDDGRAIAYRVAHFVRFRDGKVIENIAIIDSYNAAEQVLGHPLAVDLDAMDECSLVPV